MVNTESEQFLRLGDAVLECRRQCKACLWRAEGLAIKYDGTLPKDSIVSCTNVLVPYSGPCLIMLVCVSQAEAKATIVAAGKFSSLWILKANHPQLFEKMGTLSVL